MKPSSDVAQALRDARDELRRLPLGGRGHLADACLAGAEEIERLRLLMGHEGSAPPEGAGAAQTGQDAAVGPVDGMGISERWLERVTAVVDEAHAENLGGRHRSGFCEACAEAHLVAQRAVPDDAGAVSRIAELEAERQAVLDCVNLYGDGTLHSALDAIGWPTTTGGQ